MSSADELNDRVQASRSRREAAHVLSGASVALLRAVADLNHLDTAGAARTLTRRIIAERHGDYVPGRARVGDATPQTDPDLFSDDDLRDEIAYLLRLNQQHGTHLLRVNAYTRLDAILRERAPHARA